MVRCSRGDCPLGTWFHTDCMDVAVIPSATEDWWCSDECRQTNQSLFCHCKTVRGGETVVCTNDDCSYGSIFHVECVSIHSVPGLIYCIVL